MTLFSAWDTSVILNKPFNISVPHIYSKERKIVVVLCLEIPPFRGHCIYACMWHIFGCLVFQTICSCILNQCCKFGEESPPEVCASVGTSDANSVFKESSEKYFKGNEVLCHCHFNPRKETSTKTFVPSHSGGGMGSDALCVCVLHTWVRWHTRDVYSYMSRWYLSIAQAACESQKTSENLPRIMTCSPRQTYSGCSYQTEFNILY